MGRLLWVGLVVLFCFAFLLGARKLYVTSRSARHVLGPGTSGLSAETVQVSGKRYRITYFGLEGFGSINDFDAKLGRSGWRLKARGWGSWYENSTFPKHTLFVDFDPDHPGRATAREEEPLSD